MISHHPHKCLFVASSEKLDQWLGPTLKNASATPTEIAQLLKGQQLVQYDAGSLDLENMFVALKSVVSKGKPRRNEGSFDDERTSTTLLPGGRIVADRTWTAAVPLAMASVFLMGQNFVYPLLSPSGRHGGSEVDAKPLEAPPQSSYFEQ